MAQIMWVLPSGRIVTPDPETFDEEKVQIYAQELPTINFLFY